MVRDMTVDDLEKIVEIENETFSMPWSKEGFVKALEMKNNKYIVFEEHGEILGYCGYYGVVDEAEITVVCVKDTARKRGIAKIMLSELFIKAKERGIERIILEVRVSNEPAIRLYERMGFNNLGVRRDFYENPREDAYIMETNLC